MERVLVITNGLVTLELMVKGLIHGTGEVLGIGVMSGSSLDGVDLAAVRFWLEDGYLQAWQLVVGETIPYAEEWVARLEYLSEAKAEDLAKTHVFWGHYVGKHLKQFIKRHCLQVDFVGCHGHTVYHQPEKRFTFQCGSGEVIASYLPCLLVTDFRTRDVALGGQGAPFVPLVEKKLFPEVNYFLNLGGFANITAYTPTGTVAYDLTACNRVLNYYAWKYFGLPYDAEGKIAASGQVISELLERLHALPYFAISPPKSLGNEWLEANIWKLLDVFLAEHSPEDILRTWVEHIALQVYTACKDYGQAGASLFLSGGGSLNHFLIKRIQHHLKAIQMEVFLPSEEVIAFKEAIVFSYLALKTLLFQPFEDLPSITGGKPTFLGSIHLPNHII